MTWTVNIPFEAELVQESQKFICGKFLSENEARNRPTNVCDLVMKETLPHFEKPGFELR